ncbi:MAG: Zn-dependent hydrolase [Desulfotomaculum sp. 46_296]|nr:MAG: Zn-dependent hydrolase [Desulfotomaculum sp. 46_296]
MSKVVDLGEETYQIDIYEGGKPERTSVYLIRGAKTALVEVGASSCMVSLLSGLNSLNVSLSDVDYIILTHIHIDHAGGAGTLIKKTPNARLMVHPRGAKHLMNPTRLVEGTRAVYTVYDNCFDQVFGQVEPVNEEHIYTPEEGEQLDLGKGRILTFFYTPGHARHHMAIYDSLTRGLFCGDTLGAVYKPLSRIIGRDFVIPATPPSEFDPLEGVAVCDMIGKLAPEVLYFSHFGISKNADYILERNRELLQDVTSSARGLLSEGGSVKDIEEKFWELISLQIPEFSHLDLRQFIPLIDIQLCAEGIVDYLKKESRNN